MNTSKNETYIIGTNEVLWYSNDTVNGVLYCIIRSYTNVSWIVMFRILDNP